MTYTEQDDQNLMDMFRDGKYLNTIAEALGTTLASVKMRLVRLRVKHNLPHRASGTKQRVRIEKVSKPPSAPVQLYAPVPLIHNILDLTNSTCRYPVGEPSNLEYCGRKVSVKSYCEECSRVAYAKVNH